MTENNPAFDDPYERSANDDIIVVSVNDNSKKIRQLLSNETSMKIVDSLKEECQSSSSLSEKLSIPLPTVKYNLDCLVECGLVRVQDVKYSEKGRPIKIYEAPEKIIVFAPTKTDRLSIASMLKKYAAALCVALFGGFALIQICSMFRRPELRHMVAGNSENPMTTESARALSTASGYLDTDSEDAVSIVEAADPEMPAPDMAAPVSETVEIAEETVQTASSSYNAADPIQLIQDSPLFWFFLGAVFIVLILIVYELYKRKSADAKMTDCQVETSAEHENL